MNILKTNRKMCHIALRAGEYPDKQRFTDHTVCTVHRLAFASDGLSRVEFTACVRPAVCRRCWTLLKLPKTQFPKTLFEFLKTRRCVIALSCLMHSNNECFDRALFLQDVKSFCEVATFSIRMPIICFLGITLAHFIFDRALFDGVWCFIVLM
jgi:hypothetical protein